MSPHALACILLLAWAGLASADESAPAGAHADCSRLERAQAETGVDFRPPLEAKVAGKGRLYFHRAPNAACIKKTFIVPGDVVAVHRPHEGWMQVTYIGRDGRDHTGWVDDSRLQFADGDGRAESNGALPDDVKAFIGRRDECEHFIGEEPYDAERRAYLDEAIRDTCSGGNNELDALRRKYRGNAAVIEALAGYEKIAE